MAQISKEIFSYAWEEVQDPKTGMVRLSDRFWKHMYLLHTLRIWWGCPLPVVRGFRCEIKLADFGDARLQEQVKQSLRWEAEHLCSTEGPPRFATDIQVLQPAHKTKTLYDAVGYLANKAEGLGFTGIILSNGELHLDLATHEVVRLDQRTKEAT